MYNDEFHSIDCSTFQDLRKVFAIGAAKGVDPDNKVGGGGAYIGV